MKTPRTADEREAVVLASVLADLDRERAARLTDRRHPWMPALWRPERRNLHLKVYCASLRYPKSKRLSRVRVETLTERLLLVLALEGPP